MIKSKFCAETKILTPSLLYTLTPSMPIRIKYFCAALASTFHPQVYFTQRLCTMFHPWYYFMQYDQHYISRTKILNLMMKKVFWDEKLGRLDRRFSQSTIYSYLKVNSNYSWFLHRSSASRAVMPIWFEYWNVQAVFWPGLRCSGCLLSDVLQYSTTITTLGQTSWAFFATDSTFSPTCSTKHPHVIWN